MLFKKIFIMASDFSKAINPYDARRGFAMPYPDDVEMTLYVEGLPFLFTLYKKGSKGNWNHYFFGAKRISATDYEAKIHYWINLDDGRMGNAYPCNDFWQMSESEFAHLVDICDAIFTVFEMDYYAEITDKKSVRGGKSIPRVILDEKQAAKATSSFSELLLTSGTHVSVLKEPSGNHGVYTCRTPEWARRGHWRGNTWIAPQRLHHSVPVGQKIRG